MKKTFLSLGFVLLGIFINAQITFIEAEDGTLSGPNIHIDSVNSGYSGSGYVDGFASEEDSVTVIFNASVAGTYKIQVGYSTPYEGKQATLVVNNVVMGSFGLPEITGFDSITVSSLFLQAGNNSITIRPDWTWFIIDYFKISPIAPHTYNVTSTLINPNASAEAVEVYNYLTANYGQNIIAGQTFEAAQGLIDITGKSFVIKAFDFGSYSPKCAYGWENGAPAFAPVDLGDSDSLINWYNQTDGCGIPAVQFHWHSPSGGTIRTNTFMTENTTFDINQAIISGTTEYNEVIRDIDSISSQLKKIKDHNIPVLWRPLHEAGGGWFWWSDGGPTAVKALWDIMYDRMTNYHGLNNLIWVWSTPEESYYLGNNKLDIFGMDSYPGEFDYSTQKATFDQMFDICNGQKLIAMTENGPIPNIDNCVLQDAIWSFFCTWDNFYDTHNSQVHVLDVYNSPSVITLDEKCTPTSAVVSETTAFSVFPNPVKNILNIEGVQSGNVEILNSQGQTVETFIISENTSIDLSRLSCGLYAIRVINDNGIFVQKLIKE